MRREPLTERVPLLALAGIGFVLTTGGACGPAHPPAPPPAPVTCADACKRLESMGCALAKPTPQGEPCPTWCEHYSAPGRPTGIKLDCLASAVSCAAADACTY